jgi:hypothetical protein
MPTDSRTRGSAFARLLGGFLVALFVLTAVTGIILFNFERSAFDPATYKRALVSQGFYSQFSYLLSDLLTRNMNGNAPAFIGHLSQYQWKVLTDAILPEQTRQSMTEDALDQFFAYINGETDTPRISLFPLKKSLASPAGLNAALAIIRSLPDCTVQQIVRILINFGGELCNPPQEVIDLLHPVIQNQLQVAASALPDNVALLTTTQEASIKPFLEWLNLIRSFMRFSLLVPVTVLVVLTLTVVRTFKNLLIWWGWSFMLAGLIGLPLGLTGAPLLRWVIERLLSNRIPITFPPEFAASIRAVADASLSEFLKPVAWESITLFILGLAMFLLSVILTSREKPKSAAPITGRSIT